MACFPLTVPARSTVLVVDDSLSLRRTLEQLLQDAGYQVRTARDGIEAACHKPAVGYARPGDDETHPWPACAWHLNRWGGLPLSEWHAWGVLP